MPYQKIYKTKPGGKLSISILPEIAGLEIASFVETFHKVLKAVGSMESELKPTA
jgi:hypothetical protein